MSESRDSGHTDFFTAGEAQFFIQQTAFLPALLSDGDGHRGAGETPLHQDHLHRGARYRASPSGNVVYISKCGDAARIQSQPYAAAKKTTIGANNPEKDFMFCCRLYPNCGNTSLKPAL